MWEIDNAFGTRHRRAKMKAEIEVCTRGQIALQIDDAIDAGHGNADVKLKSKSIRESRLRGKSRTQLAPGVYFEVEIEVCMGESIVWKLIMLLAAGRRGRADMKLKSKSVHEGRLCGKSTTLLTTGVDVQT